MSIGDRIRVLEVFDDGWAMVEKFAKGNGKGKEVVLEPGLIPIDCLRMTGDPLPPFFDLEEDHQSDVAQESLFESAGDFLSVYSYLTVSNRSSLSGFTDTH